MTWIVGMDLRPHGAGAVRFADWLARVSRAPGGERFVPVHVLEDEHLRFVLRHHHLDEVVRSARDAAREVLAVPGAPSAFVDPEVVVGGRAEDGLATACKERGASGILIGRVATRERHGLVRLGAVARRLLRMLPAPVVVVPPDVTPIDLGAGPIMALTALRGDAAGCAFAQELALRTGRELAVVHVVSPPEDVSYVGGPTLERIARERREQAEPVAAEWARTHRIAPESIHVLEGGLLETALAFARERGVPLLVAGARGAPHPTWFPSLARELAANASIPVAVVPEPG